MAWSPLNLTVRVGCHLAYETTVPTPVLFVLKPRLEGKVLVMQERLSFGIGLPAYEFQDSHGNITYRSTFMPGRNEVRHDALVAVSSLPDSREIYGNLLSVGQLPFELLRYTLPSRYCDSDKLMNFAWNNFGQIQHGLPRVQAICDWVHNHIEYRYMSGRADLSASEVIERRYGATASVAISRTRQLHCAAHLICPRATSPAICRTSALLIRARRWIFTPTAKCILAANGSRSIRVSTSRASVA